MNVARTAQVYRTTLANPSLRRVLAAFFIFNAMEYAVWLAVTLYAFERGGATTAGLVLIAQLLPAAALAPFGSALGDRMARDRALSMGYLVQAMANVALGLAMMSGPRMLAFGFAIVTSCCITLTRPVHNSILPDLAETPDELTAANSISGTAEGLGMLVGPLMNAALIAISGTAAVPLVFGVLMVGSAALTVHLRLRSTRTTGEEGEEAGTLLREAAEGVTELRRDRDAGVLTILGGAQFLMLGMLDIFFALLAIEILEVGASGAGPLSAAVGMGGLIGAAATAVLVGRARLAVPIEISLAMTGVALALVAWAPGFGAALVLLVAVGGARAFFDISARTLLQRSVRHEVLSRVFGLQEGLTMLGTAIGTAIVPVLIALFGDQGAFLAAGAITPLAALATFGALRRLDRRAQIPAAERLALLSALPLFQPLPQGQLEQVALRLIPMSVGAGHVLIREGAAGDRFYVLAAGWAAVSTERGGKITEVGPGAPVGEIALLRDVPRTATVTAVTDLDLFALERHDFLGAVTGLHQPSGEVDRSIERRLDELGASDD
jgi:MFS family permease